MARRQLRDEKSSKSDGNSLTPVRAGSTWKEVGFVLLARGAFMVIAFSCLYRWQRDDSSIWTQCAASFIATTMADAFREYLFSRN